MARVFGKIGHRRLPGAMAWGDNLNFIPLKGGDCKPEAVLIGRPQVHAADHRVNVKRPRELGHVFDSVDDPGVGAAQQNHDSFLRVEP